MLQDVLNLMLKNCNLQIITFIFEIIDDKLSFIFLRLSVELLINKLHKKK